MYPSAKYHLYLYSPTKEHNVGIWWLDRQKSKELHSQPVRLQADLVEWVATPPVGDGPSLLSVGPYKYTTVDKKEEIIATGDGPPREWYLIPGNFPDTYLITDDLPSEQSLVWTAGKAGEPIKFAKLEAGSPNQVFQFVRIKE